MADMTRRPDGTPRRTREQRAYRLVLAGGTASAVAVVTFVLAIFGIGSFGITVIAAIVAAVCFFIFRRTVSA